MADGMKVDAEALRTHAATCDSAAAFLTGTASPASAGSVHQATTAAVAQGNALVQAAAAILAGRATSTGERLRGGAGDYTAADAGSAQAIVTTV